ncbi:MAG: trp operon repressor [Coxiellaceae bacterium]|nr:trp operon repressor [Coxiellaceae bacterium]|tara:strand:- start:921 stop:1205 length:285 start_codon:yes stop_codon:yes gene_type:complete
MMSEKSDLGLDRFFKLISAASERSDLLELFRCFFTPEELSALSLRVNVVKALSDGELTQREIAKQLHTSISKVTRGSRQLKSVSSTLIEQMSLL